ncbi:MAG: thiamine pyrophosphate-requiring protein, partial [Acidobacteriota bacterium]
HAVGGDHTAWYHQMESLADRYTVAAYDFRGHGRSAFSVEEAAVRDPVSINAFAKDTVALIEALGFRRAHLVGLSMGGVVALEVFKLRSDLVQSMTMANSWAHHPEAEARINFMTEQLVMMSLPDSSRILIPGLLAPGTSREIVDRCVQIEGQKDKHVFLSSWTSMFQTDYRRMLELIDVPMLLIGGKLDRITLTDPLLTTIQAAVPTAELVELEGANHFSNLDKPVEFTRALRSHLLRARSGRSQRLKLAEGTSITVEASTAAHALMSLLNQRGVRYFFSNSGTDFTPIIDALARYDDTPDFKLKTIAIPHENTAIAMAHGFFLASGEAQAVMAHVNVGTANMGLGIINASRSHVPMLVMAGKTPWYETDGEGCRTNFVQWGQDTFDQAAYFREFTKWDYELKGARNLETIVDRALAIASSDPAGPVYLSLPKEALCDRIENFSFHSVPRQAPDAASEPSADAIDQAARLIAAAQHPIVVTAELGRYRGGPEALVQLAQRHGIPVIEHGKRNFFNFPTRHPLHLGFNPAPYVKQADLIIAVESHVPWIPAFTNSSHNPKVVQIGVDPLSSRIPMRSFPADIALAGDPALTLRRLYSALDKARPDREKIANRSSIYASEHRRVLQAAQSQAIADAKRSGITKQFLSYCIGEAIDDNVTIWNEYNLDPQLVPRRLPDSWFENSIASGLGWSLGAALGGQLANPDQTMVVTLGDGSYLFNTPLSAHYVAAAYKLPILIIVFNDTAWSTIKKSYTSTTADPWAAKRGTTPLTDFDMSISFEKVAESCGGYGLRVESPRELPAALRRALQMVREYRTHVLLNVICERDG